MNELFATLLCVMGFAIMCQLGIIIRKLEDISTHSHGIEIDVSNLNDKTKSDW